MSLPYLISVNRMFKFIIMELEESLIKEQIIFKTKMCFCDFCNGCGIVLINYPFYKEETTAFYISCIRCNGTGLNRNWLKIKETSIEKLIDSAKKYLSINDFTAEEIRSLSKKNLKYLYLDKKLSTYKIGKRIGINAAYILGRLNLYGIKLRNFKKVESINKKL